MSQLADALRKKFKTPAAAVRALGLDAKILEEAKPMPLSSQALMARRVLQNYFRPRLAQDARVDYDPVLRNVTEKNFRPRDIAKAAKQHVRHKLAQDADLTEIAKALAAVAPIAAGIDPGGDPVLAASPPGALPPGMGGVPPLPPDASAMPPDLGAPPPDMGAPPVPATPPDDDDTKDASLDPNAAPPPGNDDGELDSWLQQTYPDVYSEWQSKNGGPPAPADSAADEDNDDRDKDREAQDRVVGQNRGLSGDDPAQDRTRGGANRARGKRGVTGDNEGPQMQPPDTKKPNIPGMDEAIKRERENQREIMRAQREVRPWVGDFAMDAAFDAPHEVYRRALEALRVPTKGIHPSAYKPILQAQPKPGLNRNQPPRVAQDSGKDTSSFFDRFPEAQLAKVD